MKRKEQLYKLGKAIRTIRELRGEKTLSMASKLGYHDASSYTKIERGECETIDLWKLIEICDLLRISPLALCLMADINLLKHANSIRSWDEFYKSVLQNSDEEIIRILELLPPLQRNKSV